MKLSETFNFDKSSMGAKVSPEQESSFQRTKEIARGRNPEKYRELEEMLELIDFNILQKIFERLAARCGVESENFNLVGPDRITVFYSSKVKGTYFIETNSIGLSVDQIKNSAEYIKQQNPELLSDKDYLTLALLHTLIHEEAHAISFRQITEGEEKSAQKGGISGYHASVYVENGWSELYTALDEGVTEILAQQLLYEYSREDQGLIKPRHIRKFLKTLKWHPSSYDVEVTLVDTLMQKIANMSGMSKESIRQAIIRSKLEGVDLADSELAQFMDEHTYAGFSEEIKKLRPAKEWGEITKTHSCISALDPDWAKKKREEKRKNLN